jgi:SAM-dependent methyltransferase
MKSRKKPTQIPYDKYECYQEAVQSPDTDVRFFRKVFRELRGHEPKLLREDFCGTFQICCEWVKLNPKYRALGIDLDGEPIQYGRAHHFQKLATSQQKRILLAEANVLSAKVPRSDITVALNFSYFLFRERDHLVNYFRQARKGIKRDGLFLIDCFGGPLCHSPNEEKNKKAGFTYFWQQATFNPINNFATFFIHFQRAGEKKRVKQFRYDWRMWTIAELRDILIDAGFKKTSVYWEGTTKKGEGSGRFRKSETGDNCQAYIAYIAAENS